MHEQISLSTISSLSRRVRQLLAAAAVSGVASTAALATSTYIGPGGSTSSPTSGDWNTAGNWSPSGIPASSASTEIDLLGSSTYTSTDDISGAFSLNILKVAGNGSTLAANSSSSILFNGSNPTLTQTGASVFTISAPVALGANTTVSQVNGGEIDFTGAVSGSGSLTLSNSTGSGNSTVKLLGSNTFGGLVVNSFVTAATGQSSNTTVLGSGTVTLNGGKLLLQGQLSAAGAAVEQQIGLTGFNADLIADSAASGGTHSSTGTTLGTIDGGNLFYENGYKGNATGGLPTNGVISSVYSGSAAALNGSKTTFYLGYNGSGSAFTSNNVLQFLNSSPQSISLTTPAKASNLQFLVQAQNASTIDVQLNFADGTSSTYTAAASVPSSGWATFGGTPGANAAFHTTNAVNAGGGVDGGWDPYLYESDLSLTSADQAKTINSIQFTPENAPGNTPGFGHSVDIYAISGDVFGAQTVLNSQTYANNLSVTANSNIDVSGSLAATMGNVSIGAQLSVTSADTTTGAYSLTLGTVTLNGSSPAFNVAASSGGGSGTLNLGAFNDGGTARTVTFNPTGTGTINLNTNASSLVQGTVLNVLGGTVNSNTNTAIGSFATVNTASTGTLVLAGATQTQVSALNGSSGGINFATSGVTNVNTTLTVGNTDNLTSSYGGVISGAGVLVKAGTGTLTLSGSNTFVGNYTVSSNGTQLPTSVIINSGTVVAAGPSAISNFGVLSSGPLGTATVVINSGATGTSSGLSLDNTPGRVFGNSIVIGSSGPAVPTLAGLNTTGTTTFSGNITLGSGNSGDYGHDLTISGTNGGEVDFTGNIQVNNGNGHSAIGLTNLSGTGNTRIRFTGSNTYLGPTTVGPNVTLIAGPSSSSTPFGAGTVNLAGGNVALQGVLPNTQQTVTVTGYNADTILDAAATSGTASSTGQSTSPVDGGNLFFQSGYAGNTTNGLNASGSIISASTGHAFQLGSYTANNTFRLTAGTSTNISLGTPAAFQSVDFLATSNQAATFSVTLNFNDSTSVALGSFSTSDWYNGRAGYNAVTGLNPVSRGSGAIQNFGGALTLQEYDATVPLADQNKVISSITVTGTSVPGSSADIYAISGATTPTSTGVSTQSYANGFNVTANANIDVSGSLNASIGTLTIGSQTLTLTSADTSGGAYSLTTGQVNFAGSAPTFNVSNSAGNGAGTLVLGSLNTGAAQHLTKLGAGTLAFNSPAIQLGYPNSFNIAGGTLASNNATALNYNGNLVAIAVANGATFSIGASQNIDALNDYDSTPVVNGATVLLNGNTLTVGSVHNPNSSFSGVISDGSAAGGGLVKGGAGTLTLYGASTYSGPTVVGFGTLVVANTTGSATGSGDVTVGNGSNIALASGTVGSIAGNVSAGQLSFIQPGGNGSIGTLSIGGLSTGFHTDINFDLGSGAGPAITNGDLLNVGSGIVNLSPYTLITLGSSTPSTPGVDYRLIGGSGVGNINTSSFILPTSPSGVTYSLSQTVDPGYIDLVVGTSGPLSLIWTGSADGTTWDNGADTNWIYNGTPTAFTSGDAVTFNDSNNSGGHYNINLASNVLPASVTVTSSGSYTIGSTGGFVIGDAPSGPTSLTQSGGGLLTISNQNTFTGPTSVSGTGTTLHLTSTGTLQTSALTVGSGSIAHVDGLLTGTAPVVTVSGSLTFGASDTNNNPAQGYLERDLGGLNVASGATVSFAPAATVATRTVLVVASSLTNAGTIDLSNNDMVLRNTSAGALGTAGSIANQLQAGFNGGALNASTGITTSNVQSNHLTALGYGPGGGTFDGVSTSASDLLIKYTYFGDATLDGAVNSADYARIDAGFLANGPLTGWSNGDFNYDGVINGSDYTLIDNAFNTQGAAFTAEVASPTAQVAGAIGASAVPEPTSVGLLLLGAAGLLGRRRRNA